MESKKFDCPFCGSGCRCYGRQFVCTSCGHSGTICEICTNEIEFGNVSACQSCSTGSNFRYKTAPAETSAG